MSPQLQAAPAANRSETLWRVANSRGAWCALCILCALVVTLANAGTLHDPDGLSYLDIASEAVAGGPAKLLNGYWSPGYPAVLATALLLVRPSAVTEFFVVHLVNFVLFCAVALVFTRFLATYAEGRERFGPLFVAFGYTTFLWCMLRLIGPYAENSADLCVALVIMLVPLAVKRLAEPRGFVYLGTCLAAGYYMKAAMLPLGLACLALLFFRPPAVGLRRGVIVSAGIVFLLLCAPLVTLLSMRQGHFTTGETGRLNYFWYTNVRALTSYSGWNGRFGDYVSMLKHGPQIVSQRPLVYAFGNALPGTDPVWYDPSYWWEGPRAHFDLRQQALAIAENLRFYLSEAAQFSAWIAGAAVLWMLRPAKVLRPAVEAWKLAWPAFALVMYAAVHAEFRFLGAFAVIFWLALYRLLVRSAESEIRVAVLAVICIAALLPILHQTGKAAASIPHEFAAAPDYRILSDALTTAGLKSGDSLAVVGDASTACYARFGRLHIAAKIPDADEFWRMPLTQERELTSRLARLGVRAILAPNRPPVDLAPRWIDVETAPIRYSFLLVGESR